MAAKRSTYRAVHAVGPGKLELVEKPLLGPPAGHVRVRVEACGVCHSDSATVEGALPIQWPRVPGHEAVGRIDLIGDGVEGWVVGQRVGVGFLGGSCGYCLYCRDGDIVNCVNQGYTGVQHDGGYAEVMMAKASGLIAVPDALSSIDAAPLLCAGLDDWLQRAQELAGEGRGPRRGLWCWRAGPSRRPVRAPHGVRGRRDRPRRRAGRAGESNWAPITRSTASASDVAKALQALGGATVVLKPQPRGGKARSLQPSAACDAGSTVISLGATDEPIEPVGVRTSVQTAWRRRRSHGNSGGRRCDASIQRHQRRRRHD